MRIVTTTKEKKNTLPSGKKVDHNHIGGSNGVVSRLRIDYISYIYGRYNYGNVL